MSKRKAAVRVGNPPLPKKQRTLPVIIWEHHTDPPTVELSYKMSQNIKRWNQAFERLVKWMGGVPADVLDKEYADTLRHLYEEKGMTKQAIELLRETGTIYTAASLIGKYKPKLNPIFHVLDLGIFFYPHINKKGDMVYEDDYTDWRPSAVSCFLVEGYNMEESFRDALKKVSKLRLEYKAPGHGQWHRQATYTGHKADTKEEKAFDDEDDDLDTSEFLDDILVDVAQCYILIVLEELGVKAEYLQGHKPINQVYLDLIKKSRAEMLAAAGGQDPDPRANALYDERKELEGDDDSSEGLEGEEDDIKAVPIPVVGDDSDAESIDDCNCEEDD